jgi:hypothetical protein
VLPIKGVFQDTKCLGRAKSWSHHCPGIKDGIKNTSNSTVAVNKRRLSRKAGKPCFLKGVFQDTEAAIQSRTSCFDKKKHVCHSLGIEHKLALLAASHAKIAQLN